MQIDVKVSDSLDRLVFVPREKNDWNIFRKAIKDENNDIDINRSAEGLVVKSKDLSNLKLPLKPFEYKWAELAEVFFQNRKSAYKFMPIVVDQIKLIKKGGRHMAEKYLNKIADLSVLDNHQWVNVACMTIQNSCGLCVFDEQGAGKTVTLIHALDVLAEQDQIDFALIVAPKSMVSEWPVDFERFMKGQYKVEILTGALSQKRSILSSSADVLVTNFETVISMEQELRSLLRRHGRRSMIVVDESFFVKNLDASRTRAIRRLREYCGRAFVLCGTPAPNSPIDLIEQFNIVDFGYTFADAQIPKDKNEASKIINKLMGEKGPYIRHLKVDVLPELPAKRFNKIMLPLQPKQMELYNQIKDDLVRDLNSIDEEHFQKNKLSFLAKRSKLLQICSNPAAIFNGYNEISTKLKALDKLLEDLIDKKGEKVILWSFYTSSLETLFNRYSKYSPVRYDGSIIETSQRREAVRGFREDGNVKLFIGNPAAAGAGLNLQSARYAIYESMSNQAAHYLQSLDRIHRRGQTSEVEYLILLCEGTIEVKEYERLIEKEASAQSLLGDNMATPFTKETMLSELLIN